MCRGDPRPGKGLKLIENTPGVAAFIVRIVGGKQQTYESKRWKELRTSPCVSLVN